MILKFAAFVANFIQMYLVIAVNSAAFKQVGFLFSICPRKSEIGTYQKLCQLLVLIWYKKVFVKQILHTFWNRFCSLYFT